MEGSLEGKRRLKDCGCGLAMSDGAVLQVCITMPLKYSLILRNFAEERGVSYSRSVVELIKVAGLDPDMEVSNAKS